MLQIEDEGAARGRRSRDARATRRDPGEALNKSRSRARVSQVVA